MESVKLKVLQDIGYEVRRTCGNCRFSEFGPAAMWGTCSKHAFVVLKYSESAEAADKGLGVRFDGSCPQHDYRSTAVERLRGYQELLEK